MQRLASLFVLVASLSGLSGVPAIASELTVRVLDAQGAGIPRAKVQLVRRDLTFTSEALADDSGGFAFRNVAAGAYLASASAEGFARKVVEVRLEKDQSPSVEFRLEIAAVEESIVVTPANRAERQSDTTKTTSVVRAEELESRDEYFIPEALRTVPGLRMEQLGGPGAYTSLRIRGLRSEDTAILIDGARLRDPSAPQGDASSFIENLVVADVEQVEILRGAGSSVHGTNAGAGVINIVTAPGGGEARGSVLLEGGGLGFFRGGAQASGGFRDRFHYSLGATHVNVSEGVDGDDPYRNTTFQGRALFALTPRSSLSFRFQGTDAHLGLNESPETLGELPPGEIPAIAFENFTPSADDPDNVRDTSFYSTLVSFEGKPDPSFSYSLRYHGLVTSRSFAEGPLGPSSFEPSGQSLDLFDGSIHTLGARSSYEWGARQVLDFGYDFERESFRNESLPDPAAELFLTDVAQTSQTLYVQDQVTLLDGDLLLSLSARGQFFSLSDPRFEPVDGSPYQGIDLEAGGSALTGDVSFAYAFASKDTRVRAHFGNGYRAPSLFERFGAFYGSFGYSVYGDPRLAPESTSTFDAGIEKRAFSDRLRVEATYFHTRLNEIIVFDFSGAIDAATDPFGRFGGYLSTDGGVAQGIELVSEVAPGRDLDVKASYTFNDAEPPRGVSEDQSQAFGIPRSQFSLLASKRFGPRFALSFDLYASSSYLAPIFDPVGFESRVYRFDGYVKADLVGSYRLPLGGTSLRLFGKIENLFDETIYASGFLTPGRYASGGISFEF
jgi:iron complex outermembrane receptor protein